jgi:hypothetical protein
VCLKRVKGASIPQDKTMVLIERNNEGRLKEGNIVELNTLLLLRANKR